MESSSPGLLKNGKINLCTSTGSRKTTKTKWILNCGTPCSSKADTFYFLTLVIRILLVHHCWFLRITNTELSEEIHEKRPVQIFTQLVQDKPEKFITKYLAGIVKVILAYFFAELHFLQWKISFLILECKNFISLTKFQQMEVSIRIFCVLFKFKFVYRGTRPVRLLSNFV